MKNFLLTSTLLLSCLITFAQISLTEFPKDKQLYPRDLNTNKGTIVISGQIGKEEKVDLLRVVFSTNTGKGISTTAQKPVFKKGIANFSFKIPINAELTSHRIQLFAISNNEARLIKEANDLVAGDAFIINGQSNSVANSYGGSVSAYEDPFIRSFGTTMHDSTAGLDLNWYLATGDSYSCPGVIGQWGLMTANAIVKSQKIPVAVIAGGVGGTHLLQHMRTDSNPENLTNIYGRLLFRVHQAGLQNNIRAIWWHQGESDAYYQRTVEQYKELWNTLKISWLKDYRGVEHYFTFQIRHGCGVWRNFGTMVMEAQRQLALDSSNVSVVSTNGVDQNIDFCHFQFNNGYRHFAERLIPQVLSTIYKVPSKNQVLSPDIASAVLKDASTVVLTFKNCNELTSEPGSQYDFVVEGTDAQVIDAIASKNTITLKLSKAINSSNAISYCNHPGPGSPYIKTANNNGVLSFYSFPIK